MVGGGVVVAGVVVVLDDELGAVLAGLTEPEVVVLAVWCFFFLPLGVSSSFCAELLPVALAELLLAAGMVLPDGVVPAAGGVLDGPVGVLAEASVLSDVDAPAALPEAEPDAFVLWA